MKSALKTENKHSVASPPLFNEDAGVKSPKESSHRLFHSFGNIGVHSDEKFSKTPVRIQPKLRVNQPGDEYEREADAMAEKVIRMPESSLNKNTSFNSGSSVIQRKRSKCEEEEHHIQRKESQPGIVHADTGLASYVNNLGGSGSPLPHSTRNFFETRFGYDFSNVRVHTGSVATKSAENINALAYTRGNNIVFNRNQYSPSTQHGKRLLAHELTHVIQQSNLQLPAKNSISSADSLAYQGVNSISKLPINQNISGPIMQRQVASEPAYNINLVYPPNHTERHQGISQLEALRVLRMFSNRIDGHLAGGEEGHRYLIQIHNDQSIIAGISDLFGGARMPSLNIWASPRAVLRTARESIERADINAATRKLQQAAVLARNAERQVHAYREGTISGADRTVFGLEVVQVASTVAVSVYTGGTAGVLLGAGLTGAQRLAGEAMSVRLGLQDRIDWVGIGFDTLFAAVAGRAASSRFVGRLGQAIAARLGSRITAQAATALIIGRASGITHAIARELFDGLRGRTELTVDGFIHRFAEQLTLRAAFLDLIGAAVGRATPTRPTTGTPLPERTSEIGVGSPTRPRLASVAGGDTRPIRMRTNAQGQRVVASRPRPISPRGSTRTALVAAGNNTLRTAPVSEPVIAPRPIPELVPAPESAPVPQEQQVGSPANPQAGRSTSIYGAIAAATSSPSSGSSPTAAPSPAPATVTPPLPAPPGEHIRLEIPSVKGIHLNFYRSHLSILEHRPDYVRTREAQSDRWDQGVRSGGSGRRFQNGMRQETYDFGRRLGLPDARIFRPNWSRLGNPTNMQVDHKIELQVVRVADYESWGDQFYNYELLDQRSNSQSGNILRDNIRRERNRLQTVTGNSAWQTCILRFTQVLVSNQPGSAGTRWSSEEIQRGDHLRVYQREVR